VLRPQTLVKMEMSVQLELKAVMLEVSALMANDT